MWEDDMCIFASSIDKCARNKVQTDMPTYISTINYTHVMWPFHGGKTSPSCTNVCHLLLSRKE